MKIYKIKNKKKEIKTLTLQISNFNQNLKVNKIAYYKIKI